MITSDKQYKVTKSQIEDFKLSLKQHSTHCQKVENVRPKILEAERDAIDYMLRKLLAEVKEYEDLKAGRQSL